MKNEQPKTEYMGKTLALWFVFTNRGRKQTWKQSANEARRAVESKGLTVIKVTPGRMEI